MSVSFPLSDVGNGHKRRKRLNPHRQFISGQRSAIVRALTAAQLLREGTAETATMAARMCGSCPQYVKAAGILHQNGDQKVIAAVLNGDRSLLEVARGIERVSKLVKIYKAASPAERVAFGKAIGVPRLFDQAVAPSL
jgi:hypothetical protein